MVLFSLLGFVVLATSNNNTYASDKIITTTATLSQDDSQTKTDEILEYMEVNLDCDPSCWAFIPHESTMAEVYEWFLTKFSTRDSQRDDSIANNFVAVNVSGFELVAFSSELEDEIYLDSMYVSFPHDENVLNELFMYPDYLVNDELSPTRISIAHTDYTSSNIKNSYYLLVEFSDPDFAILYWGDLIVYEKQEKICINESLKSILWFVFSETHESSYLSLVSLADYENSQGLRFPLKNLPNEFIELSEGDTIKTVQNNLSDGNCIVLNDFMIESNQ